MFAAALFARSFLMSALEFSRGRKAGQLLFDCGFKVSIIFSDFLGGTGAVREAPTLVPHHCLPMAWMADARGCPVEALCLPLKCHWLKFPDSLYLRINFK